MDKKIVAVVPARFGSERVKYKNLRLIAGKPLIYYIIESLRKTKYVDEIYVNSDSELIGKVAKRYGVSFYKRSPDLATSKSLIDDYIYDFLTKIHCDILAVVNPTSPFLTSNEIDNAIQYFLQNKFDTLLACENVRTHCFLGENPINFSTNGKHPRSQDLEPIKALNFAITIWDVKSYIKNYQEYSFGVYTGTLGFYSFEGFSKIDIDWEEDFILAEIIMENIDKFKKSKPQWDPVLENVNSVY